MKKTLRYFVSYAHRNKQLTDNFMAKLQDVLSPSKSHDYRLWRDTGLVVGEEFEAQILEAIEQCDFGLLLISPAFLASKFITEKELPAFVSGAKPSAPVMLQQVDFKRHDLKGLDKRQIFRLDIRGFEEPRAYGDCKPKRRDTFVLELFKAIEDKFA